MNVEDLKETTLLRRFCFVGELNSVYSTSNRKQGLDVKFWYEKIDKLVKILDDLAIVQIVKNALQNPNLIRKDETLFIYATYLAVEFTKKEQENWKNNARMVFPLLIIESDDLFMFAKYHVLIRKNQNRKGFSRTAIKAIRAWYTEKSAEQITEMWSVKRGEHGFTHKILIKLCHIDDEIMGQKEAQLFFKKSTFLADPANNNNEMNLVRAVSKLRTIDNKNQALKLIKRHNLKFQHVPPRFLSHGSIVEALLPSMTYLQLLKNWKMLSRYNHLEGGYILQRSKKLLQNKKQLSSENIPPINFLLHVHNIDKPKWLPSYMRNAKPKKKYVVDYNLPFLQKIYKMSFGLNASLGLKMHITINLQNLYKKHHINNQNKLNYLEAAVALAFGLFKKDVVDVAYWTNEVLVLKDIPFKNSMSIEDALECCNKIQLEKCHQQLISPILNAMVKNIKYDLFVAIVSSATLGNKNGRSEILAETLASYRQTFNPDAKMIIVDLCRFKKSMQYSDTKVENILEICGIDENITKLIETFAHNSFV